MKQMKQRIHSHLLCYFICVHHYVIIMDIVLCAYKELQNYIYYYH